MSGSTGDRLSQVGGTRAGIAAERTTRQALYLKGLEVLSVQVYEEVAGLEAFAARAGYPVLR